MSDRTDSGPETAIDLAETFLDHHRQQLSSGLGATYEKEIQEWQERKADLEAGDDLYELAEKRIEEYEEKLEQLQTDVEDVEERFLKIIASGFTAKGKWLDARILRALNLILFNKYSESFVIKRHVLEEGTTMADDELFGVSRAVRERASDQLGET